MTLLLELIEDAFNLTEGELRRVEAVFDGSGDGLRALFEAADFELAPVADAVLEVPVVSDSAAQLARKLLAAAGTSGQLTRAVYLPG